MSRPAAFKTAARRMFFLFIASTCVAISANGQQQPRTDEVLRTRTELIQTYVTVVDKSGKFVDGLNRGQFQLLIDGQPRAISFFDRVTGGNEPSQVSESRDSNPALPKTDTGAGN
jgi:hypothetical protein